MKEWFGVLLTIAMILSVAFISYYNETNVGSEVVADYDSEPDDDSALVDALEDEKLPADSWLRFLADPSFRMVSHWQTMCYLW